jgi:uncharacterized protein
MLLTEHRNEHQFFLRHADAHSVTIIDRRVVRSVLLSATAVAENFPARRVEDFDDAAIAAVLALQPEVVLLGTGARPVFPPPAVLAEFLRRGIGVETMDNAAAARTFNVLAGEGRQVVAVFLLEG